MSEKVGAVLVVGGGIGGMQASLDLANTGIKVYLADRKSCIGGMMSQLDKTFPTDDCAMCSMAPRLVEIGRHKDIELITLSKVESIRGKPGNFTVTLRKKARYVDEDKCTGCGDCEQKCPVEVLSDYNLGLASNKAIYRRYPQAIPSSFVINKLGHSPCRWACPAGQKAQGYIALIREKRYEDAYKTIIRDNPFPSVCGRVCKHYCEEECTRQKVDESVSIKNLKRFIADWAYENKIRIENGVPEITDSNAVAVIGSGPAGLTAARDLRAGGYRVTIFEALAGTGGMLRYGIPDFRLPPERLKWDIRNILTDGIEVKTNHRIESIDDLFKDGYRAIFIAAGTQAGKKLKIPGSDLPDVLIGLDFLRSVALKEKVVIGERLLVLGGGNVAMDVARTAVRLGAKRVRIACLESREKMTADPEEIKNTESEGITIFNEHAFLEITSVDNHLTGTACVNVNFHGFDENGIPDMDVIEGTGHIIEADTVIFAIGQSPELSFIHEGIELTKSGTIKVDKDTLATSKAGVFAGGDVVSGTKFVVDAISAGQKAAISIDRYLKGEEIKQPEVPLYKVDLSQEEIIKQIKSREKRQNTNGHETEKNYTNDFSEVESVFTEEQALKEAQRCLNCGICSECMECVEVCGPNAINHDMPQESLVDIDVGAIILASGNNIFDPDLKKEYGYKRYPNVITSLQFERILSASGPFRGKVVRPSDETEPEKVAFIQCIGSRNTETGYCSSVCCMAAIKEATIAKEHKKDLECTIFYTDLRAFGKGYEDYYNKAKKSGIRFVKCRPSSIKEVPATHNLKIKYLNNENEIKEDTFDLVVMLVGLQPDSDIKELSEKAGITLDESSYCRTSPFEPVKTDKEGIYVIGTISGPKDIPETVIQASAASSKAMELLIDARGNLIKPEEYPSERDVAGENPRVGVFICHCGKNIGGVVNVPEVRNFAGTLPDVVYAVDNLYTCSTDTAEKIREAIEKEKLNRVVVASCSPRTHEALFQDTLRESGLNPYLFEMANIRDQCSWPHMYQPEKATIKAKGLVAMAVAKARLLEELYPDRMKINQNALVIGGGLAGMTAALSLSKYGVKTYLVEKDKELGGNSRKLYYKLDGFDSQKRLKELIGNINGKNNIHVYKNAKIEEVNGSVGKFKTLISNGSAREEIEHGVIIVATGGMEYKPEGEYLYGQDKRVLTQVELEGKIALDTHFPVDDIRTIVMIQCVGARNEKNSFCSRICCMQAIKNALKLKEINPEINIFILYRDIRTYGFYELYYREARQKGVIFIRYDEDLKPVISEGDPHLRVRVKDTSLNTELDINADYAVLSAGPVPSEDNEDISKLVKIPLSKDGFFLEKHIKLNPLECAAAGVYLCGLAHYPKSFEETITSAEAAAMAAWRVIGRDEKEIEAKISHVLDDNCDGCAYCVSPCPNNAITLLEYMYQGTVKKTVEVDKSLCAGCGICMATCPKKGIYVKNFKPEQIMAQVETAIGY